MNFFEHLNIIMAQSRVFSIVGDSNVKRNISKTNSRACPQMSGCQLLQCFRLQLLDDVLRQVRPESNVCILSCISNFLASSDEDPMVSKRVEPVLDEFCTIVSTACTARPEVSFLISPPMYRTSPLWYREGLPELLTRFSSFLRERPANLHLLPSFPTPDFERDGIHLTAYSGLEFMIHLFDSAVSLLDSLNSDCEQRLPAASEATRLLEDRVVVLEQDHRRLNQTVELRTALDAELHDYHENVANEAFLVLTGCDRILGLTTKEWQDRAKAQISPVLKELMGHEVPIQFVSNTTGPQPDALVRFNVKLFSVAESKAVREKFGSFYVTGEDKRPPFFKRYSIRNLLTQGSRIRLAILQVIGRRFRDSNKGSQVKAIGYDSRPILRIIPASDAKSRKVRTYNFIEAVQRFPTNFNKSDLDFIFSKVGYKQKGLLRSLFICISDDMFDSSKKSSRQDSNDQGQDVNQDQVSDDVTMASGPSKGSSSTSGSSGSPSDIGHASGSRGSRGSNHGGRNSHSGGRSSWKRGAPWPAENQLEKSSRN